MCDIILRERAFRERQKDMVKKQYNILILSQVVFSFLFHVNDVTGYHSLYF